MFLKTNLGYLSQIALKNMQLLVQIGYPQKFEAGQTFSAKPRSKSYLLTVFSI